MLTVLVTRPDYAAKTLCEKINALNMNAQYLPTIEVSATPKQDALQAAIAKLVFQDILIFVSRPSVYFAMPAIKAAWDKADWGEAEWDKADRCKANGDKADRDPLAQRLRGLVYCAIGPGTAQILHENGVKDVLLPKRKPFETESLLEIDALQNVQSKNIMIFCGNGGRTLLIDSLQQRGAVVEVIETYQRSLPTIDLANILNSWQHQPQSAIDVILTTSLDGLHNLMLLMGSDVVEQLKSIPIVVVGLRMYERALKLGFKRPLLSEGADDHSLLATLEAFKDQALKDTVFKDAVFKD